jgi:hypothetical protein
MTDVNTDRTKDDLLKRASELDIAGRSGMNKDELEAAIATAETTAAAAAAAAAAGAGARAETTEVGGTAPPLPAADEVADPFTPASPDNPTDGRPPLAEVATTYTANDHVRVIGADGTEED